MRFHTPLPPAPGAPPPLLHVSMPPPPRGWSAERPWAMFIDLDGTLCPFEDDPGNVHLSAAQQRLLTDLAVRLEGALCILSGRAQDDLARIVGDLAVERVGD